MDDPEPLNALSAEMTERIIRGQRDGVTFSMNWQLPPEHPDSCKVTEIHWRPGDPNALAEQIVGHVKGPMRLDLDGTGFVIMPAGQYDGELPPVLD